MKYLIKDVLSCWYELSWQDDAYNPAIIVRIHQDLVEKFKEIPPTASLLTTLAAQFKFKSFCGTLNQNFGFEHAFKKQSNQDGFDCFSVNLPKVKKAETVECGLCQGSGKGWIEGEECWSCKGSGREHVADWHDAFAASASFTAFFAVTFYNELETSAKVPQLLTVQTTTQADMHGGSLGGMFGIPLVRWLAPRPEKKLWK